MSTPVAIVTGGSSGIGLALSQHLQAQGWKVAILDLQAPPAGTLPEAQTLFLKTDVSQWGDNAASFAEAVKWGAGRLDFAALNAGIDERDDIFSSLSLDAAQPPKKPNMLTFEVDLFAPYYGIKLAAHYMALNTPVRGGKIVVTSSAAGLRGAPVIPQYCASKHGLVGLVRSLAPLAKGFDITLNAVCPAVVQTGLAPPGLMDGFPAEQITPMSTIMRAFSELVTPEGVKDRAEWVKTGHNGQVVEADLEELYYRQQVEDTGSGAGGGPNDKASQRWISAYLERNKNFALTDWEKGSSL